MRIDGTANVSFCLVGPFALQMSYKLCIYILQSLLQVPQAVCINFFARFPSAETYKETLEQLQASGMQIDGTANVTLRFLGPFSLENAIQTLYLHFP